jgi:hypothetical protein
MSDPQVINNIDITGSNEELALLNKGFKCNRNCKLKHWIRILAIEAGKAINFFPVLDV